MSLSVADAERLRDIFQQADTDGSGGLDPDELKAFLINQGETIDDKELADLYAVYDVDHNGVLTFDEFLDYIKKKQS
jgi:Ca2+-binding EF-hand superfamily protein